VGLVGVRDGRVEGPGLRIAQIESASYLERHDQKGTTHSEGVLVAGGIVLASGTMRRHNRG
jgi:hypothetical protein